MNWAYRLAARKGWPRWKGELLKQAVDQPLHVLMAGASVCFLGSVVLVVMIWSSWICLVVALAIGELFSAAWIGLREFFQYPSREEFPLDWLLDAVFEVSGLVGGGFLFYSLLGPWVVSVL